MKTTYFWFRRDLRLEDNVGLSEALKSSDKVQCIFIFDEHILSELPKDDPRVSFIYQCLNNLEAELRKFNSSLRVEFGTPEEIWNKILENESVEAIYTNKDYEPYARKRDGAIRDLAEHNGVRFERYKDQVIFEEGEVVKADGKPYTVYTPYKNLWLKKWAENPPVPVETTKWFSHFAKSEYTFPSLEQIGFLSSDIKVKDFHLTQLENYDETRDFPALDSTSYLSPHLRFGTVGIRQLAIRAKEINATFLSELIWREFFMQILYHFPKVQTQSFKPAYDNIPWKNDPKDFEKWCKGETGYAMVDAGMRQLNETGYMHNRVRMVVASFLCKHLLIDWRWGEAYFAKKLLDFDLSANNGNWQWAAGCGCDAAPYFRVFNPTAQLEKFDPKLKYIRTWVKDFDELTYPKPMVDHSMARDRAINTYKAALNASSEA